MHKAAVLVAMKLASCTKHRTSQLLHTPAPAWWWLLLVLSCATPTLLHLLNFGCGHILVIPSTSHDQCANFVQVRLSCTAIAAAAYYGGAFILLYLVVFAYSCMPWACLLVTSATS